MLRSVPLKNKPLCIISTGADVYIGDARGVVYLLSAPYTCPRAICEAPGPVSAMAFHERLYYGTWDGTVFTATSSRHLGANMIKCLGVFRGRLFASVDSRLVVLDQNLEILEEHPTESKIHCMDVWAGALRFGMASGLIAAYTDTYIPAVESEHGGTVLCMREGLSGSTRGSLMRGSTTLYSGEKWVRAVWDERLFAAGNLVIADGKEIYRHNDEVVGLVRVGPAVISIGLDYCYKVYHREFSMSPREEEELLDLLNS